MKITQIGLYEVPIPPIAKYFPKIYDLTICRIQTDEGIVGLGETQGKPSQFEEEAASYEGKGPLALDPFSQSGPFTCALLDIAGQAFGFSVKRCMTGCRFRTGPVRWSRTRRRPRPRRRATGG